MESEGKEEVVSESGRNMGGRFVTVGKWVLGEKGVKEGRMAGMVSCMYRKERNRIGREEKGEE